MKQTMIERLFNINTARRQFYTEKKYIAVTKTKCLHIPKSIIFVYSLYD